MHLSAQFVCLSPLTVFACAFPCYTIIHSARQGLLQTLIMASFLALALSHGPERRLTMDTRCLEQYKFSGGRRNLLDQNKSVQQGRESERYDETRSSRPH